MVNGPVMAPLQTLVVAGTPPYQVALLACTSKLGYRPVGHALTIPEAVAHVKLYRPHVIVLPMAMSEAVPLLTSVETTAIVLSIEPDDAERVRPALEAGVSAFLTGPFTVQHVRATLEGAWYQFQRLQAARVEITNLKEGLETRKLVDRAKGILMASRGISEPEAYRLLQRMSQDKRVSIKDVCKAVEHIQMVVGTKTKSTSRLSQK